MPQKKSHPAINSLWSACIQNSKNIHFCYLSSRSSISSRTRHQPCIFFNLDLAKFYKISKQSSCHLASSPLGVLPLFGWPNHLSLPPKYDILKKKKKKTPGNIRLVFTSPIWLAHFASFWVDADHHKSLLGQGTEINKERDRVNDRGWVQKPCHTVCWLCWASWHRPMFCKLFICTQITFHSDAKGREGGDWCCMWEVCAQILLSDNGITRHASWACFESLLLNLHI